MLPGRQTAKDLTAGMLNDLRSGKSIWSRARDMEHSGIRRGVVVVIDELAGALAYRIVNQSARARLRDELAREMLVVAVHAKKDIRNSQKAFTRIPPAVYDDFGITPNSCEKEAVNDRKC